MTKAKLYDCDQLVEPIRDDKDRDWLTMPFSRLIVRPSLGREVAFNAIYYAKYGNVLQSNYLRWELSDGKGVALTATEKTSYWYPYQLSCKAIYPETLGSLELSTSFFDTDTVVQYGKLSQADVRVVLSGEVKDWSQVSWDAGKQALCVVHDDSCYAIMTSLPVEQAEIVELESFLQHIRKFTLKLKNAGKKVTVSTGFATKAEGLSKAIERARDGLAGTDCRPLRKKEYDELLADIPVPRKFPNRQVELSYYKAWHFLYVDILPPLPEHKFPYIQFSCGKPTGIMDFSATSTAIWESTLASQPMAFKDPELAWQGLEGLMYGVEPDGMLPGEFLPPREMQTAHILYYVSGDLERLRRIYPAMKRLIQRTEIMSHWNHCDSPDERDFMTWESVINEMWHAERIARLLDLPKDAQMWNEHYKSYFKEYIVGLWPEVKMTPKVSYYPETNDRRNTRRVRSAVGGNKLAPAEDTQPPALSRFGVLSIGLLDKERKRFLIRKLREEIAEIRKNPYMCGGYYPPDSFGIYGMLNNGLSDDAAFICEQVTKGIAEIGDFSETYNGQSLTTNGNKPTLFGAEMMIDYSWLLNGFRFERGIPCVVMLPGKPGGVRGLRIMGKLLNIAVDPSKERVELSGEFVDGPIKGFTIVKGRDGSLRAVAKLAVGKTIPIVKAEQERMFQKAREELPEPLKKVYHAPKPKLPVKSETLRLKTEGAEVKVLDFKKLGIKVTLDLACKCSVALTAKRGDKNPCLNTYGLTEQVHEFVEFDTSAITDCLKDITIEVKLRKPLKVAPGTTASLIQWDTSMLWWIRVPTVVSRDGLTLTSKCAAGSAWALGATRLIWEFDTGGEIVSSATVADLDGDGENEVILFSSQKRGTYPSVGFHFPYDEYDLPRGNLIVVNSKGTEKWRRDVGVGWWYAASPVVVDLDGDGKQEVIIGTADGCLYVFGSSGETKWTYNAGGGIASTVAVADINADGKLEILVSTRTGFLHALDSSGKLLWRFSCYGELGGAVVTDLPGRGKRILVSSLDRRVYCLKTDGTVDWAYNAGWPVWATPAVGDVDGDGKPEIVVGSHYRTLHVIDANGKEKWTYRVNDRIWTAATLADLKGDGKLNILFGCIDYWVYCLDGKGKLVWKFDTGARLHHNTPTVADINLDGKPEVIVSSDGATLYVLNNEGREMWRAIVREPVNAPVTVADVTGDGKPELVLCSFDGRAYLFAGGAK